METINVEMKRDGLSMECDRQEFALALKTWRLRRGLTQKQVAEMFGLSRWTIIDIEKAKSINWKTAYRAFAKLAEELRKEGQQ